MCVGDLVVCDNVVVVVGHVGVVDVVVDASVVVCVYMCDGVLGVGVWKWWGCWCWLCVCVVMLVDIVGGFIGVRVCVLLCVLCVFVLLMVLVVLILA